MKVKVGLLTIALGATLALAACGSGDSESKDKAMNEEKTSMSAQNEKISSMAMLSGTGKHQVSGKAMIKDNKLTLTDFSTDEGPDLHVYLTKGDDVKNGLEISAIDLKDKTQTFDIPDKDISKYDTVMIYCEKAHEIFGQGMLSDKQDANDVAMMKGDFEGVGKHMVSGMVTVSNSDLELSNFKTDEGPDLHVYLTKSGNIDSGKEVSDIDLKATEQTFSLGGIETADYDTVVIYCEKAHEAFGQAKLS